MGAGKDLLAQIIRYVNWKRNIIKEGVLFKDSIINFEGWGGACSNKNIDYKIKKFADILKDTVCLWINCTREQLEDRDFKNKPLSKEWDKFIVNGVLDKVYDYESEAAMEAFKQWGNANMTKIVSMTPRILLQRLGTEGGRQSIHQQVWVNTLFANYNKKSKWIITDCRFPNEAVAVAERGGVNLRIVRPSTEAGVESLHESEIALDKYTRFDKVFFNDGSIQDLVDQVEEWIK